LTSGSISYLTRAGTAQTATEVKRLLRVRPGRRRIVPSKQCLGAERRVDLGFAEHASIERADHNLVHVEIRVIEERRVTKHLGEMHIGRDPQHIVEVVLLHVPEQIDQL